MFDLHLKDSEKFIALYRKTEVVLIIPVMVILIGLYVPLAYLLEYDLLANYRIAALLWTIVLLFYGVYKVLLWRLNVFALTNERVIKVTYESLFKKEVSEVIVENMAAIRYKNTGIFSTLFNYGNIEIQIMGLPQHLILEHVREPALVKEAISNLKNAHKSNEFSPKEVIESRVEMVQQTLIKNKVPPFNAGDIKIFAPQAKKRKIV